LIAGRGSAGRDEESNALRHWYRVGPEITLSLLDRRGFMAGIGLGYQAGYYDGGQATSRRHEISSRIFVRYLVNFERPVEHGFGLGVGFTASFVGPRESGASSSDVYSETHGRLSLLISYGLSIRIGSHWRLALEATGAWAPGVPALEVIGRIGFARRF